MIRVGKPMAPNTYAVYNGTTLVEIVFAISQRQAYEWAQRNYGNNAYAMENAQARDIT